MEKPLPSTHAGSRTAPATPVATRYPAVNPYGGASPYSPSVLASKIWTSTTNTFRSSFSSPSSSPPTAEDVSQAQRHSPWRQRITHLLPTKRQDGPHLESSQEDVTLVQMPCSGCNEDILGLLRALRDAVKEET